MSASRPVLTIEPAPHAHAGSTVPRIMAHVAVALLPVIVFSVWLFGLAALVTLAAATLSCLAAEWLLHRKVRSPLRDGSALITGLTYGLVLPPSLPLWMVVAGGFVAIGVGKVLFGGLGVNAFNPALVGRVFLQAAFPAAMTTWLAPLDAARFVRIPESMLAAPFMKPAAVDGLTGATPLAHWKFAGGETPLADLTLGLTAGSTGETGAILLLAGGLYLVAVRVADWRIPVAILATAGLVSAALHGIDPGHYPDAPFMLLSGGLMLGAWFMATDPVASPVTHAGAWVYGTAIGLLVLAIRLWSGQPEGVMYAILLGNALSPHIDRWIQPRVYGTSRRRT